MTTPEFWEAAWQAGQTEWEIGAPAPPLARLVREHARPGLFCVVLGCGSGSDLLPPLEAGCLVTGVDLAPSAIARAARRLVERGARAELACEDLFSFLARRTDEFDLALEHTCYCAIPPARRAEYAQRVAGALRPGGRLLALFYEKPNRPMGPPWGTSRDELQRLFSPAFEIASLEVPPDSIERRAGRELLGVLAKRDA